ncbi:MAG: DUF5906 domain-containing protein [Verrucomicrobiota bacterium]|nr:DUF5906 domain-containing protein [Verrucomicrobiota bacterium]
MPYIDKKKLEKQLAGRWFEVFNALVPALQEAVAKCPKHVPCPMHGGKDGFRFFKDASLTGMAICNTCGSFSPYKLLEELNGWDFNTSLNELANFSGYQISGKGNHISKQTLNQEVIMKTVTEKPIIDIAAEKHIEFLLHSKKPNVDVLMEYLSSRGISSIPAYSARRILFDKAYKYIESGNNVLGTFPTLFSPFEKKGQVVNVQRLYLSEIYSKSTTVDVPKKMIKSLYRGALNGATFSIMGDSENSSEVAITEGIETGLAVSHCLPWLDVKATGGTNSLKTFQPPKESIKLLYVFGDNDKPGIEAVEKLCERLEGQDIAVHVFIPPNPYNDWLDVLNAKSKDYIEDTFNIGIEEGISLFTSSDSDIISVKKDCQEVSLSSEKLENDSNDVDIASLKFSDNTKDIMKYLNHYHFFVRMNSDTRIGIEEIVRGEKKADFLSEPDFNRLYKNWSIEGDKKSLPVTKYWMTNLKRREYKGVIFDPAENTDSNYYNLFYGWAVKPKEGNCTKMLWHLENIICDGNTINYEYVIKWFSHLFQKPEELPGVALFFLGAPGVGKSLPISEIGKLLGQHFVHIGLTERLTSRFNSILVDKLLICADEFDLDGKKTTQINAMITEKTTFLEKKGIDPISIDNYSRFVFASNELEGIKLHEQDRRFLPLQISDKKQQDTSYFKALVEEMDNGGREALLEYFLSIDLSDFDVRIAPRGKFKFDFTLKAGDSFLRWLYQLLKDEEYNLPAIPQGWQTQIRKDLLFNSYNKYCREEEIFAPELSKVTLAKKIFEIFHKSLTDTRITNKQTHERERFYIFATLDVCRKAFQNYFKAEREIWDIE